MFLYELSVRLRSHKTANGRMSHEGNVNAFSVFLDLKDVLLS